MFSRIVRNWVYGGALAGLLLFGLTFLLAQDWPIWLTAVWLMLPIYMLHQLEEHDADRFRLFVNKNFGGGRELLTPLAVFIINIPGVWGGIAASWALAWYVRPGLGLIAIYLVLVNAVAHIGAWLALRRYNPGLWTAILLFFPLGGLAWRVMQDASPTKADHLIGLASAVGFHLLMLLWAIRKQPSKL